jgi:hypothetical protein
MMKDFGIIYIAWGKKFLHEFFHSYRSLVKYNPTIPVTVLTDSNGKSFLDSEQIKVNIITFMPTYNGLKQKAVLLAHSPYTLTLFLDTDTEIRGNILDPFSDLDNYDICIAGMRWLDFSTLPPSLLAYEKPHPVRKEFAFFNTGVIYYRNDDKFKAFHQEWEASIMEKIKGEKFEAAKHCDQYHFNEMLSRNRDVFYSIRIKTIPNTEYNCRPLFFNSLRKEGKYKNIKVVHEHYLDRPLVAIYREWRKKIGVIVRRLKQHSEKLS